METITTGTGKEFKTDYYSVIPTTPSMAYIRVMDDLVTAVQAFSDPAETSVMRIGEKELLGYTRLVSIKPEIGAIKICLAEGGNELGY